MRPLPKDQERIITVIRPTQWFHSAVLYARWIIKTFKMSFKSRYRTREFQFSRQTIPCTRCSHREHPVTDLPACFLKDHVLPTWRTQGWMRRDLRCWCQQVCQVVTMTHVSQLSVTAHRRLVVTIFLIQHLTAAEHIGESEQCYAPTSLFSDHEQNLSSWFQSN